MNKAIFTFILPVMLQTFTVVGIAQQQPENPGFENWEDVGIGGDTLEPVDWSSLKTSDGGPAINSVIPVVWERSTDAHSGMYSVKLTNKPILVFVAPGTLTNGRVHAAVPPTDAYVYTVDTAAEWNTPFNDFPDSLVVWAKYLPQGTDKAHVIAVIHTDTAKILDSTLTDWVAFAHLEITSQTETWTRFSIPFTYLNTDTPDYILFAIFAGDAQNSMEGSIMYLDDVELIYNDILTPDVPAGNFKVYFSDNLLIIDSGSRLHDQTYQLEVFDLSGRALISQAFTPTGRDKIEFYTHPGVYVCKIHSSGFEFSGKLIKR